MNNPNSLFVYPSENLDEDWIALVGPEIEENLSLRYLASSLAKNKFHPEIIAFNASGEMNSVLHKLLNQVSHPVLIALSLSFQWRAMDFLGLAVALRESGYKGHITAGGHFGNFHYKEILTDFPEIDSFCFYESEETLAGLAKAVIYNEKFDTVEGIAFNTQREGIIRTRKRRAPELSALPWPDRRGEPNASMNKKMAALVSSRGCYGDCSFCCISALHRESSSGKKFRMRPIDDIADEMAWLVDNRKVSIFIFHDDNFFLPRKEDSLLKIHSLADALEKRGINNFATVVKARPDDIDDEICFIMKERLGLLRLYLGVETDSQQGLKTLGRNIVSHYNHSSMDILLRNDIYVCYNMLIFDPDTDIESLKINLDFIKKYNEVPVNFSRVELYAGTPILARMLSEKRCYGDYLGWDYALANKDVQNIFRIAKGAFRERNYGDNAMAIKLMNTRFNVEVLRCFYPERYNQTFLDEVKDINKILVNNSVDGLKKIIDFVNEESNKKKESPFIKELNDNLRMCEQQCNQRACALEMNLYEVINANQIISFI